MIDPSPSQIRSILSMSVDSEKGGETKDAELDAVKNRLQAMEDKDVNSLWYSIAVGSVSGLVSFGSWVGAMFASGAWTLASTGAGIIASNPGLAGEIAGSYISNEAIERLVVPGVRDALQEIAYRNSLPDEQWLEMMKEEAEQDMEPITDLYDLWEQYRVRRIPGFDESNEIQQPGYYEELPAVRSDFERLITEFEPVSTPATNIPGQNLTWEGGFSNEGINVSVDELEFRIAAGDDLSLAETRTPAELKWERNWRIVDDLNDPDELLPEPLPDFNNINGARLSTS